MIKIQDFDKAFERVDNTSIALKAAAGIADAHSGPRTEVPSDT